jgi:4'-phosphopantetheinyl transferase
MHEPLLDESEIHVWRIALDGVTSSPDGLRSCLSAEEEGRAALLRAPRERERFIVSRIALRDILSRYHGLPAAEIPLARERGGRPFVEGAHRLFFSLSHTAGAALVAVAGSAVGVDVERVRPVGRLDAIARRVLHPDTAELLAHMPPAQRQAAFLDAWTQREAHVKAVGGGLFRTADVLPFDPALPDDGSTRTAHSRDDGAIWTVARFLPFHSARAAIAAHGALEQIRMRDWNDIGSLTTSEDR